MTARHHAYAASSPHPHTTRTAPAVHTLRIERVSPSPSHRLARDKAQPQLDIGQTSARAFSRTLLLRVDAQHQRQSEPDGASRPQGEPQRHRAAPPHASTVPRRLSSGPGRAPVCSPPSITTVPLTITVPMPAGYWCGSS